MFSDVKADGGKTETRLDEGSLLREAGGTIMDLSWTSAQ